MSADIRTETIARLNAATSDISALAPETLTTFIFNRDKVNLESHQLVWLDANMNNTKHEHTTVTLAGLRKIIDYTKLFDNIQQCKEYVERTENGAIFLVTSGSLGETFVPDIHETKSIYKIYVYCENKDWHRKWAFDYPKIENRVHTKLDELLSYLKKDVSEYLKLEKAGAIMNVAAGREDRTTDRCSSWWRHFIDILCCISYPIDYRQRLLDTLKFYYNDKEEDLKVINEFEAIYEPNQAVWWYTRDTFFYRLLNRSLRQHNVELIFLFGFYLKDVNQQLKEENEKLKLEYRDNPKLKLYRGQVMSMKEIEKLKQLSASNFNINNCLLSTSLDRDVSLDFLKSSKKLEGLESVFFEIDVDVCEPSRPYGNISHLSAFPKEDEILLMIGVQFDMRLGDVTYDENDKIWLIKCSLHYSDSFEGTPGGSPRRILKDCISRFTELYKEYDDPEDCNGVFNELIHLFPSEKEWILAYKLWCQAKTDGWSDKRTSTQLLYDEIIKIWLSYPTDDELNFTIDISNIHESICWMYTYLNNQNLAKKHFDLAITYFQSAIENNSGITTEQEKRNILDKLVTICGCRLEMINDDNEKLEITSMMNKYNEQAIQLALNSDSNEDRTVLPFELGVHYAYLENYDDALINFGKAYEAANESNDSSLMKEICVSMVSIYIKHKKDFQKALKYHLISHEHTLKNNELKLWDNDDSTGQKKFEIAESHLQLADIYRSLDQYDLSKDNFITAKNLYKESGKNGKEKLAPTIEQLADIEMKFNENDVAYEHLDMALKLYQGTLQELENQLKEMEEFIEHVSLSKQYFIMEAEAKSSMDNNDSTFDNNMLATKNSMNELETRIEEFKSKIKIIEEKLNNLPILII